MSQEIVLPLEVIRPHLALTYHSLHSIVHSLRRILMPLPAERNPQAGADHGQLNISALRTLRLYGLRPLSPAIALGVLELTL